MPKKRRDHFVPRLLIRHFCDHNGRIFCFDKQKMQIPDRVLGNQPRDILPALQAHRGRLKVGFRKPLFLSASAPAHRGNERFSALSGRGPLAPTQGAGCRSQLERKSRLASCTMSATSFSIWRSRSATVTEPYPELLPLNPAS